MRLNLIKAVFLKELKETLRDRRSMWVMFGIPLILYPVVTLGLAGLGVSRQKQMTQEITRVALVNGKDAPTLAEVLRTDKRVLVVELGDTNRALETRNIEAVVVVPPNAEAEAMKAGDVKIQVRLDRSRSDSAVIERRLDELVAAWEKQVIRKRLAAKGIDAGILKAIDCEMIDVSSGGQRLGKMLSLMLPNVLLLTGMLGAFFPALNSTTTEREVGTLETLLVCPVGRSELLLAKGSLVLLSSLTTAALNLVSMSLVLWWALSNMGSAMGQLSVSPLSLLLSYLAAVPAMIFFAALVMAVGLFARNFREANSYATPVMLLPLISVAVSIAEPRATVAVLITPVVNTTVIIRDVLTGQASIGPFVLAFVSSCVYAGLMISGASRLFTNEQLVNPAWEPLSLRGLRRGGKSERRLPAIDEAVVLFAAVLLLLFYLGPILARRGLLAAVAGSQLVAILAPTLLIAWLGRYRWRETFSLKGSSATALIGAVLMGIGIGPAARAAGALQQLIWPRNLVDLYESFSPIVGALKANPVLIILVIATLAGVCEELLFRGLIQGAIGRRSRSWPVLAVPAVLFAAAHMDLHGMPIRALLGVLFGWMVLRSGSIIPAMLAHGLYDATQLTTMAIELHRSGWRWDLSDEVTFPASLTISAGVGLAMFIAGLLLFRRAGHSGKHWSAAASIG